jgi:hypothetical protein
MRPVGLTLKRGRKRYAPAQPGELMLVHQCAACGAWSLNRLAADDCPASLWDVFEALIARGPGAPGGIDLLDAAASDLVRRRLFGAR